MSTLNINKWRLTTEETVRFSGPFESPPPTVEDAQKIMRPAHGVYTMTIITEGKNKVQVHMTLEALIQLEQRIAAAKQHMITH